MIRGLKGVVENKEANCIEIDVGGVIYKVFVSKATLEKMVIGEKIKVVTYMHVREEEMSLYGFINDDEVDLFEMLIGVSGVGPKSAMAIFNENNVESIRKAVLEADVDFFRKVKGLGLKTSQKIIIELKNKIGSLRDLDLAASNTILTEDEVYLSLIQLGFDRKKVGEIMKKIPKEISSVEDKLSWCLRNID